MKHYEYEINLFIDGELENEKQSELFSHLAGCGECQKLLADSLELKERTRIFCAENLNEIKNKPKAASSFYKYGFYASAVAAVLLVFLLATVKPKEVLVTKNEVRVDTVFVEKEKTVAQVNRKGFSVPGNEKLFNSQEKYLHYVNSLRTIKFTDADFIEKISGS